jgi:hypothetical protein
MKLFSLITLMLLFASSVQSFGQSLKECKLIVIGEVMQIGKSPQGFGRSPSTWDARYSVIDVLKGKAPKKKGIWVGHLVLKWDELEDLQVGDRALLCLAENKPGKKYYLDYLSHLDYLGKLFLIDSPKCREKQSATSSK